MNGHGAFARARAMFALISAAVHLSPLARAAALGGLAPYESHGKRKTAVHHAKSHRRDQRAAQKRKNVLRNRKAHR